jgi:hypothetical protein
MTYDEQKAIVQQYADHITKSAELYKEGLLRGERSDFKHPLVKAHMAQGRKIPYWMIGRLFLLCEAENTLEWLSDVGHPPNADALADVLAMVQAVPTMEGEDVYDHVVSSISFPTECIPRENDKGAEDDDFGC